MKLTDYESQMHVHISLFDYVGAKAVYERALDRFKPEDVSKSNPIVDSTIEQLCYKVAENFELFNLEGAIEGLDTLYAK